MKKPESTLIESLRIFQLLIGAVLLLLSPMSLWFLQRVPVEFGFGCGRSSFTYCKAIIDNINNINFLNGYSIPIILGIVLILLGLVFIMNGLRKASLGLRRSFYTKLAISSFVLGIISFFLIIYGSGAICKDKRIFLCDYAYFIFALYYAGITVAFYAIVGFLAAVIGLSKIDPKKSSRKN